MNSDDLTIEILQGIRQEARTTNERLEALELRQSQTEVRLATELVAVVGAINEVKALLVENLSTTLKDHERRITVLESRSTA